MTDYFNKNQIDNFKNETIVAEFIKSLIDDNFSREYAPEWINYDLFFENKFENCVGNLLNALYNGFTSYDDHELVVGYISDSLDDGTGDFHSAVDDICNVTIPREIIEIYNKYVNNRTNVI